MKLQTIKAGFLYTISWHNRSIVDWASNRSYGLDNSETEVSICNDHDFNYQFGNKAICSSNGEYAFIYERLGTKGLLLKKGKLLREINRSYYFANSYEYPAAFVTINGKTYLIHCPIAYNQLDIEDVETGKIVTNIPERKPFDIFHSRLEVSADGNYLLSKGWVWHPISVVMVFDIAACLTDPMKLDHPQFEPKLLGDYCTASFINNSTIVVGSSDELQEKDDNWFASEHLAIWELQTNELSKPVKVKSEFGNIFAINSRYVWDMYKYPKIIDLHTGRIVDQNNEISSGLENSSINGNSDEFKGIVFNRDTKQIAIKGYGRIDVLTPDEFILQGNS
ncbi:MAG: hypothetical protein JKY70_08025 [Mucilaginibacter sp.]|nr:hypothetical protein [Mucilaginibacter sp.]